MHIFMDETGSFAGTAAFPSPSFVGALIVPDARLSSLEKKYKKLREKLPLDDKSEVKGRALDEVDVAAVVDVLMEHGAVFDCAGIELGAHTNEGLDAFQAVQAEKLTASLTEQHHPNLREQVQAARRTFEGFKHPLMVQSVITFELVARLIEMGTMYFSMRRPDELAKFTWVIDAKGNLAAPNEWETWWSTVILPFLQARWFSKPMAYIPIGDYSKMKRFEIEPDEWTKEMGNYREGDPKPLDLVAILKESFSFSAAAIPGLELVDIITNATRRAIVGNLGKEGWKRIPELMIHRGTQYISMHSLEDDPVRNRPCPYLKVMNAYRKNGRELIPANLKHKKF
jgi:hypothetical protein